MTIQSDQDRPRDFFQSTEQLLLVGAAIIVLLIFALGHVW